jgi:hypothetical protein
MQCGREARWCLDACRAQVRRHGFLRHHGCSGAQSTRGLSKQQETAALGKCGAALLRVDQRSACDSMQMREAIACVVVFACASW